MSAPMPADRPDLQALVENPREALEVEIKDWMDRRLENGANAAKMRKPLGLPTVSRHIVW
jgi:hypothetical protein